MSTAPRQQSSTDDWLQLVNYPTEFQRVACSMAAGPAEKKCLIHLAYRLCSHQLDIDRHVSQIRSSYNQRRIFKRSASLGKV